MANGSDVASDVRSRLMAKALERAIFAIAVGAILGLGGWIYSTSTRIATVEASSAATRQAVDDIQQDVRDLRNALLGPREQANNRPKNNHGG